MHRRCFADELMIFGVLEHSQCFTLNDKGNTCSSNVVGTKKLFSLWRFDFAPLAFANWNSFEWPRDCVASRCVGHVMTPFPNWSVECFNARLSICFPVNGIKWSHVPLKMKKCRVFLKLFYHMTAPVWTSSRDVVTPECKVTAATPPDTTLRPLALHRFRLHTCTRWRAKRIWPTQNWHV